MKNKTVGRLINDEQLKHLLNDSEYYGTHAWDELCDMISECDAVDAVQVVRCKDCKYMSRTTLGMEYACWHGAYSVWGETGEHKGYYVCIRIENPDYFCADGERREE